MPDQSFTGVALAFGTQSALGTVNATIAGLSGSIDSTDGIVLGDRESGDANSGITLPSVERVERALADLGFTRQPGSFQRSSVSNLAITIPLKGNGVTSTPSAGQAKPLAGIDALLLASGFSGANGTSPVYTYTPSGTTTYGTAKLWVADLSYVFMDCVTTFSLTPKPGDIALATFTINVGSVNAFADTVTFPTLDYTTQSSLSAPVVQGVAHSWSTTRGFNSLTITNENSIAEIEDSNQSTGIRLVQEGRSFDVSGTLFVDSADSDFEYQNVIASAAPTADLSFQLGSVAGASDTINAVLVSANNLQLTSAKDVKLGTVLGKEIAGYTTGATANSEFTLTFN